MKRPRQVDGDRFVPEVRILLPNDPLERGTDAVVADENVEGAEPLLGFPNRLRAALGRSQVGDNEVQTRCRQRFLAARGAHDPRTAGREKFRGRSADASAGARHKRDTSLYSRHDFLLTVHEQTILCCGTFGRAT